MPGMKAQIEHEIQMHSHKSVALSPLLFVMKLGIEYQLIVGSAAVWPLFSLPSMLIQIESNTVLTVSSLCPSPGACAKLLRSPWANGYGLGCILRIWCKQCKNLLELPPVSEASCPESYLIHSRVRRHYRAS